jgi:hypothetical protein
MDDYYKIAPPSFAYLWVSANFTKLIKTVIEAPPTVESTTVEPNDTVITEVVPEPLSPEMALERYRALQKQVDAERTKPIDQQNYTNIKKALIEIAENETADKAARYAKYVLKQLETFDLVLSVAREVRLQNEQLEKNKERIDKARTTRLAGLEDLGRFAVVGEFQTFATYGPGHYRITNKSGKTICYALPSGWVSKTELGELIGHEVGLLGSIEPHPQTASALVRFTEVVDLD